MSEELKPCPFCGEMPELEVDEIDLNGSATKDSFKYYCDNCDYFRGECDTVEEAVKYWNKRATDRLEQENAEIKEQRNTWSKLFHGEKEENDRLLQENAELREALQAVIVNSKVKTRGNDMLVKSGVAIYGEPLHYEVALSAINEAKQLLNK